VGNVLCILLPKFYDDNNVVNHVGWLAKVCVTNNEDKNAHNFIVINSVEQCKAQVLCRDPSFGRECERVWRWRLTLPSEFPLWELESQWTPELSKSNYRGQNTLHWRVLYIIEKLLKCKCLKWARMTHLDICNTSYGKKKGWESNWQFDSWPRKVKNRPDFRACRWCATHR
jgi:hypothetical protein